MALKLGRDEVKHIATLARVGLTGEELDRLSEQLSNILENFAILQELDTTDVPPTSHPVTLSSVFRDDEAEPSYSPEEILANAPRREEDFFRVKAILEEA